MFGISIGVSSIAEIQIDQASFSHLDITSRRPGPLTDLVTATGSSTTDTDDLLIGTKIRIAPEGTTRPAFGFRFATKLPNANNESGLGLDTTDFFASVLAGKTTQSVRVVGNIGFAILGDPTNGNRQNDVVTYGVSFARAITNAAEVVGEVNGRANTRSAGPLPGTESRSIIRMGLRYTIGGWRADGAVLIGATKNDPADGSDRPAVGAYVLMPGTIAERLSVLRVLSGRFLISDVTTAVDTSVRCTSKVLCDSAVTFTPVSSTALSCSVKSSDARWPTSSRMLRSAGEKPSFCARTT